MEHDHSIPTQLFAVFKNYQRDFTSSKTTQWPAFNAANRGPSRHANSPPFPPSTGRSVPNKSVMSCQRKHIHIINIIVKLLVCWKAFPNIFLTTTVCSDRLILTRGFPEAFASAATKLVFPTPGEPSSRTGLCSFKALRSLWAFIAVVPAAIA